MVNMALRIEFAFATPEEQMLEALDVPDGSTIADVIDASGVRARFPRIDVDALDAGIWGRVQSRDTRVTEGDRVELYRNLLIDPREARRLRAKDSAKD